MSKLTEALAAAGFEACTSEEWCWAWDTVHVGIEGQPDAYYRKREAPKEEERETIKVRYVCCGRVVQFGEDCHPIECHCQKLAALEKRVAELWACRKFLLGHQGDFNLNSNRELADIRKRITALESRPHPRKVSDQEIGAILDDLEMTIGYGQAEAIRDIRKLFEGHE